MVPGTGHATTRAAHSDGPGNQNTMIKHTAVQDLFPTPIWNIDLEDGYAADFNRRLVASLSALIPHRPNLPIGKTIQTDPVLHRLPEFREFVDLAEKAGRAAADFLKLKQRDLVMTGCWANINPPGGLNSAHTHPNNFLSGVYYIQTPDPKAGGLAFTDPRPQAYNMTPPSTEHSLYNANNMTIEVLPGRMILFPAWLTHAVAINATPHDRISIAFNLMFRNYVADASPAMWRGSVPVQTG
jgi:uncharacterized protein (TIGR02466 family)